MESVQAIKLQRQRQENRRAIVYHVGVLAVCLLMLYPLIWLFSSSLKAPDEVWTTVTSLIPRGLHFENYVNGWQGFGGISFATFYGNSFIYAGVGTLLTVASSAVIAYGFARVKFRGSQFWFAIMMLTLMLPTQVLIIPQFIIFKNLGWTNTFLPLLLPRIGGDVFFIFLIIQFIRGIPRDLDEAAMIDGADQRKIFYWIILPQLKPALITAAIFSFYFTWDDFLNPLIYMNNQKLYTVSLALRSMADPASATDWGSVFAMLGLSLIPVFLIFVLFQRYIVEGIATTGLKG